MYTESQLNSMNKGQVVNAALNAINKLEALSKGPLTADMVKAEVLNLKQRAVELKHARATAREEYDKATTQMKLDHAKELAEQELKYRSEDGQDGKAIDELYKALETRAAKAEKDLTFGLEKAENEANIELAKISEKLAKKKEETDAEVERLSELVTDSKQKTKDALIKADVEHKRAVEQQTYDHKIALRDKDKDFIEAAAKELDLSLIEFDDLKALEEFKAESEEDVTAKINEAITSTSSKIYATENAKLSKIKNEADNKVALLENDNNHLKYTLATAENRIKDLEDKLALVPGQIAAAVASAKSEVTVNQDAAKK